MDKAIIEIQRLVIDMLPDGTHESIFDKHVNGFVELFENQSNKIKDRSDKITLLEAYSKFLMKGGYLDTDWKDEPPFAIDEFLKEENTNEPEEKEFACIDYLHGSSRCKEQCENCNDNTKEQPEQKECPECKSHEISKYTKLIDKCDNCNHAWYI